MENLNPEQKDDVSKFLRRDMYDANQFLCYHVAEPVWKISKVSEECILLFSFWNIHLCRNQQKNQHGHVAECGTLPLTGSIAGIVFESIPI